MLAIDAVICAVGGGRIRQKNTQAGGRGGKGKEEVMTRRKRALEW